MKGMVNNMKMTAGRLSALFGLLVLVACGTVKEGADQYTELSQVTIQEIAHGNLYGGGAEGIKEENIVIHNQQELDDFLMRVNSLKDESSKFKLDIVNFEYDIIIACFDQVRPNGSYDLKIVDVLESNKEINVILEQTHSDLPATSVMIQPYHIISIPATEKAITYSYK